MHFDCTVYDFKDTKLFFVKTLKYSFVCPEGCIPHITYFYGWWVI